MYLGSSSVTPQPYTHTHTWHCCVCWARHAFAAGTQSARLRAGLSGPALESRSGRQRASWTEWGDWDWGMIRRAFDNPPRQDGVEQGRGAYGSPSLTPTKQHKRHNGSDLWPYTLKRGGHVDVARTSYVRNHLSQYCFILKYTRLFQAYFLKEGQITCRMAETKEHKEKLYLLH